MLLAQHENSRLYAVIDRLQPARPSGRAGSGSGDAASDADSHTGTDMSGAGGTDAALLVKRLEEQNQTLQREMSLLNNDAADLKSLKTFGQSSASQCALPPVLVIALCGRCGYQCTRPAV